MMHYSEQQIRLGVARKSETVSTHCLCEDWLELHGIVERLDRECICRMEWQDRIRKAAAAVVKEVYAGGVCSILTIDVLRIAAGIPAPPVDENYGVNPATHDERHEAVEKQRSQFQGQTRPGKFKAPPADAAKGGE